MIKIILGLVTAAGTVATGSLAVAAISAPEEVRTGVHHIAKQIEPESFPEESPMDELTDGLTNENEGLDSESEDEANEKEVDDEQEASEDEASEKKDSQEDKSDFEDEQESDEQEDD